MTLVVFVILCKICVRFLLLASSGGFLLPGAAARLFYCRAWRQAPVSTGSTLPAWWFDPTLLICEKKRGVEPPRKVAQRNPLERVPLDASRNRGTAVPLALGLLGIEIVLVERCYVLFERSIVGGTTNLAETWRKANFLWKFLLIFPTAAGTPSHRSPPQGFLQSKNALRRRKTNKLLGRQIVVRTVNRVAIAIQNESTNKKL